LLYQLKYSPVNFGLNSINNSEAEGPYRALGENWNLCSEVII